MAKKIFGIAVLAFLLTLYNHPVYPDTVTYDFSNPADYGYDGNILIGNGKAYVAPNFNSEATSTYGTLFLEHYENAITDGAIEGNVSYEDGKFSKSLRINPTGRISYSSTGKINGDSGTVEFWLKPYSNNNLRLFKCAESGENWIQVGDVSSPSDSGGVRSFETFKGLLYASVGKNTKIYRSDSEGLNWTYVAQPGPNNFYANTMTNYDTTTAGNRLYASVETWDGNYGDGRTYSTSDGTTWSLDVMSTTLHSGKDYGYRSSCVYNGKLYVGTHPRFDGTYSEVYNGTSWDSYAIPVWNGYVQGMCPYSVDGKLYATANTQDLTGPGYVCRFDGTSWTTLDTGVKANNQIVEYNGSLYIAQSGGSLKKYDGSTWTTVTSPYGDKFISLCVYNNKLYVGAQGNYGKIYVYDGTNWATSFTAGNNDDSYFHALKVFNNKLFAGSGDGTWWQVGSLSPNAKMYRLSGIKNGIEVTQTGKDFVDFIITDSNYVSSTINIPVEYFPVSEWHHWAFSWNSSEMNVYRDGIKIKSFAGNVRLPSNTGSQIVISENMLMDASIDDFKISNYSKPPLPDTSGKILFPALAIGEQIIPAFLTVNSVLNNGAIGYRAITGIYSHSSPQDISTINSFLPSVKADTLALEITLFPSSDNKTGPEINDVTLTYVKASSPFIIGVSPEKVTKGQNVSITLSTPVKLNDVPGVVITDAVGTALNVTAQEGVLANNLYSYSGTANTKSLTNGRAKIKITGTTSGGQAVATEKEMEIFGTLITVADGGTVELFDNDSNQNNNTLIKIPKDAVRRKNKIDVVLKEISAKGEYEIKIYDENGAEITGLLSGEIELQLHYNYPDFTLDEEKNLAIYYWDGVKWVFEGGTVDAENNVVKVKIRHLSKFAALPSKRAGKFSFIGVSNEVFTPNGDGINDFIKFQVDNPSSDKVDLKIYDANGKLVRALDENYLLWDGRDANAVLMESGMYVYILVSGNVTKKGIIVLKK